MKLTPLQTRLLAFFAVMGILSLCICVIVVFLIFQTDNQAEDLLALNNGAGTTDLPISSGKVVFFADFNVLPVYFARPATDQVLSFHVLNRPPSGDSDYVLVRFRFECKKNTCQADEFNVRIIDDRGGEWGRPFGILLTENLEGMSATEGGILEGWQVFSIPKTVGLRYLKMWQANGSTLYALLPPQR